ncbi:MULTISPECIES: GNAT family N-acetyltransferase [unclassified Cryobacterium]|uniref:GNAT family N-acetyltransferase n=1 Tax=unclassified Cryobacterium TaxID=2649013 RepID=UPI00106AB037|nr:GNAT family N-acetyltransferase [Cryobacterium sp. TMB3-1-2]TFC71520.1 GNAT family N-acetyltransferase [Cryobacterium sp. TMB3-15]TFC72331.1 GNAT family N-acetyltransferase [Cryobacterium sp. TMB3-10]TFD42507.1 GNAT family N-acetyltransferase [Cryobacterium sp. TMB3-12]
MALVTATGTAVHAPADWRRGVTALLDFLPALYPDGDAWLAKRLDAIERGDAWCALLEEHGEIAGVSIGVLKVGRRFKICTLYVRPESRGRGGGSALLDTMMQTAKECGAASSYITAAHTVGEEIRRTVEPKGFLPLVTQLNRYGLGRHETVFATNADGRSI